MTRNRASAKAAGARFERHIADTLAEHVDDRIDRRVKTGAKDRGDIAGIRHMGHRVVIECKDTSRTELSVWTTEAEIERGNDDALAGLVVHKRRGHGDPLDQYVTCTVRDLVALLTGTRVDR
jgi:Holliday junction resolvase